MGKERIVRCFVPCVPAMIYLCPPPPSPSLPIPPFPFLPRSIQSRIDTAVVAAEKLWREQHRAEVKCVKQEGEVGGTAHIYCTNE